MVAAIAVKLLLPPRQRLSLAQDSVVLERGKQRVVVLLDQCQWWCSPWHQKGIACGAMLVLESATARIAIGGAQHTFNDPQWLRAAPASDPDGVMLAEPFAELLNALGYAMRHRSGG